MGKRSSVAYEQLNIFDPPEEQVRAPNGNKRLVEYGILNERSDFRAHVTYKAMRVYVFPTKNAAALLAQAESLHLQRKSVFTGSLETAQGYLVPVSYLEGLNEIIIPPDLYQAHRIYPTDLTTTKGLKATQIVLGLLKHNLISLPLQYREIDSLALQISGTDILINSTWRMQVKCDWAGGEKRYGGTGNLYLQTAECNPYSRH